MKSMRMSKGATRASQTHGKSYAGLAKLDVAGKSLLVSHIESNQALAPKKFQHLDSCVARCTGATPSPLG